MLSILKLLLRKKRSTNDVIALIFKIILIVAALAGAAYLGYKIYEKVQEKRMRSLCCCDDDCCCDDECCECDDLIIEDLAEEVPETPAE